MDRNDVIFGFAVLVFGVVIFISALTQDYSKKKLCLETTRSVECLK